MQLVEVTSFGLATLGVDAVGEGLALYSSGGQAWLIYGQDASNGVDAIALGGVTSAGSGFMTTENLSSGFVSLQPGANMAVQLAGSTTRLFSFGDSDGALVVQNIGSNGMPGTATSAICNTGPLTGVTTFEILGGATGGQAALSFWNAPGLKLYGLASTGALTYQTTLADTAKSYLGNVSDTAAVSVGGHDYLLTLSSLENGITSFSVDAAGKASLIDSLGTIDQLPLSGPSAMQAVVVGGVTFAVIASTNSGCLAVVRVNDMGCLFATDWLYDDTTTRFANPQVLDTFSWAGRSFIVSGGTDAGVTVLELRPDGSLAALATGVFETGAGLADVTGLEVAVSGSTLDIYVVDAAHEAIHDIQMDLSSVGGVIKPVSGTATGTGLGDLIWGGAAAETLNGGGGDDVIFDGAGADAMSGGAGADVFVFCLDTSTDRVTDFALHSDRLDLSDWGQIYSASALTITSTSTGATIAYAGNTLTLVSADGKSIAASAFVEGDFLFS